MYPLNQVNIEGTPKPPNTPKRFWASLVLLRPTFSADSEELSRLNARAGSATFLCQLAKSIRTSEVCGVLTSSRAGIVRLNRSAAIAIMLYRRIGELPLRVIRRNPKKQKAALVKPHFPHDEAMLHTLTLHRSLLHNRKARN